MASNAELLILDEPTSGLDPLMERVFTECVDEVRGEGRTILLSSHILSEVERVCDRVSIIRAGRTVRTGSLAELRELTRTHIEASLGDVPSAAELSALAGAHDVRVDGDRVSLSVEVSHLGDLVEALGRRGIRSLVSQPPTLEELFMSSYQDPRVGAESGVES